MYGSLGRRAAMVEKHRVLVDEINLVFAIIVRDDRRVSVVKFQDHLCIYH
jgi:hypothetical protein